MVTVHDDAFDSVRAQEGVGRFFYTTFENEAPHRGGRQNTAPTLNQVSRRYVEPATPPEVGQGVHVTRGTVPKSEIRSHHHESCIKIGHQDAIDEFLRSESAERPIESEHVDDISARLVQEANAVRQGRQDRRMRPRSNHLDRVGIKGDDDQRESQGVGLGARLGEKCTMTSVHPIEHSDGDNRTRLAST